MTENETSGQETDELTEKRAAYEGMEYRVPVPGRVRVENVAYGDESEDHVYVVEVENGEAVDCSCPASEYHGFPCKHGEAVRNQPAVLMAASTEVASDGDCNEKEEAEEIPDSRWLRRMKKIVG